MNAEGKTFQDKIEKMPAVKLVLSNEHQEELGKIETLAVVLRTNVFNVRASFPNPNRLLRSVE
jgi:membrane fusion protein (multidrug efflux system)